MKERLIVAEKVMKTLFKRNRDLEESNEENQINNFGEGNNCQKCQEKKDKDDDDEDDRVGSQALKDQVKELEKQLASMQQSQKEKSTEPQSYKDFMSLRLEQSQAEARRHFENYVNIRDQLNHLMEKQQL